MHKEILTKEQIELLPLVRLFSDDFGLVGGTAIALHLGHRRSINFDLFTQKEFDNPKVRRKISRLEKVDQILRDETGQFTLAIRGVRFTFFQYPFSINYFEQFDDVCRLPDLLTLAAMKVFALGQRAKWKDYVDLYFIMKTHHGLAPIAEKAKQVFSAEFNERIIREQLAYFDDINYSEEIEYLPGYEVDDKLVKNELVKFSLA